MADTAIADELALLAGLATRINLLPGPNRHAPGVWYAERDEIARTMARSIGRLRKLLGIAAPVHAFTAPLVDSGVVAVRQSRVGTGRAIPVERRPAR